MQQGPAARIVLHQQLHHVLCPVRVTPSESTRPSHSEHTRLAPAPTSRVVRIAAPLLCATTA